MTNPQHDHADGPGAQAPGLLFDAARRILTSHAQAVRRFEEAVRERDGVAGLRWCAHAEAFAEAAAVLTGDPRWLALASQHRRRVEEHAEMLEAHQAFKALEG